MADHLDSAGVLQLAATGANRRRAYLAEAVLVCVDEGVVGCLAEVAEQLVHAYLEGG
jgi:hypothetical protein